MLFYYTSFGFCIVVTPLFGLCCNVKNVTNRFKSFIAFAEASQTGGSAASLV